MIDQFVKWYRGRNKVVKILLIPILILAASFKIPSKGEFFKIIPTFFLLTLISLNFALLFNLSKESYRIIEHLFRYKFVGGAVLLYLSIIVISVYLVKDKILSKHEHENLKALPSLITNNITLPTQILNSFLWAIIKVQALLIVTNGLILFKETKDYLLK